MTSVRFAFCVECGFAASEYRLGLLLARSPVAACLTFQRLIIEKRLVTTTAVSYLRATRMQKKSSFSY